MVAVERARETRLAPRLSGSRADPRPFTVARFLRPYRRRLALVLAILLVNAALGLANPWLVQQLVDRVLLAREPAYLWLFAAVFVGVALFRFGTSVVQGQVYAALSARVLLDMRRDFLEHVQRLSLRFFGGTRFGELVVRFNRDLSQVQEFATGALPMLVTNALTVAGVVVCGVVYDADLFLVASLPFPFALLLVRLFRARVERQTRGLRELSSDLASSVNETFTGQRAVRSFGRERRETIRFVRRGHALIRAGLDFQLTNSFASGLPRLCLVLSTVVVYGLGGARVIRGEMPLGHLIALSMYLGMAFGPLMSLVDFYLELTQTRVSLERVRALRDQRPDVIEDSEAPLPPPIVGELRFDDVHFRHEPDVPLLEGVSFALAPGETVALVGASGAGKSTIVDLAFRFLDPTAGRVLVDGQDLKHVRTSRVRDAMAVVSQDVFLFHDTVEENVRFGRPGATAAECAAAARAAGVDTMLPAGTLGIATIVGERGLRLSAGQRQRIAIARALLRAPRILVLDEATSALDYASDRAVRAGIVALAADATTLIVTHRLSHVLDVDRVLVLDEGRIVEVGTPAELARSARFGALFDVERGAASGSV